MTRSHLLLTAEPGRRDELLDELDRLQVSVAVRDQPGFLTLAVLVPDGDPDRVLVEGSWSSVELFERWRSSRGRQELLTGLEHLLAGEPQVTVSHVVDTIS